MITIHKQNWPNFTKYIIVNKGSSLLIDLFNVADWFGGTAFIYSIYTDEDKRNQGYATELLNKAEEIIKSLGHKDVYLECNEDYSDTFVTEWYYRKGYECTGAPRGYLMLRKTLI